MRKRNDGPRSWQYPREFTLEVVRRVKAGPVATVAAKVLEIENLKNHRFRRNSYIPPGQLCICHAHQELTAPSIAFWRFVQIDGEVLDSRAFRVPVLPPQK